jgi:catechol 2,3-dioxygenase-like lactoylglutathione lyase family enzyme
VRMRDPMTIYPVLPASDLDRARAFYRDKLGLEATMVKPGVLCYSGPSGYIFQLYETSTPPSGHTQMSWACDELDAEMAALRARGVVFEDVDVFGVRTDNGVGWLGSERHAWFKDSEGNMICIWQPETARG